MLRRIFFEHPKSVNESYFEYARFALGISGLLIAATIAALVHAVFPYVCLKKQRAVYS